MYVCMYVCVYIYIYVCRRRHAARFSAAPRCYSFGPAPGQDPIFKGFAFPNSGGTPKKLSPWKILVGNILARKFAVLSGCDLTNYTMLHLFS